MTYRAIRIKGVAKDLVLSKCTVLKFKHTNKRLFHLDELPDGTWRLTYSVQLGDSQDLTAVVFNAPESGIGKNKVAVPIEFTGWDIELPFNKINRIKRGIGMIAMDEQNDGSWSLLFSEDMPNFRNGFQLDIIREEEPE